MKKIVFLKDLEKKTASIKNNAVRETAELLVQDLKEREGASIELEGYLKFKELCLNGAPSWRAWTFGGCGLIYNKEIKELLELKGDYDGDVLLEKYTKIVEKSFNKLYDFAEEVYMPDGLSGSKFLEKEGMHVGFNCYEGYTEINIDIMTAMTYKNSYELMSLNTNCKGFYHKAIVKEFKGFKVLYSYGKGVCVIKRTAEGFVVGCPFYNYSMTTKKHIKEFLMQEGVDSVMIDSLKNNIFINNC